MINKIKENRIRIASVVIALLFSTLAIMFPVHIETGNPNNDIFQIGKGTYRITIGNIVNAQTANYTCDGINDHETFQEALNALPEIGGELLVLAGTYVWGDAETVTRDIDNVSIIGVGASVYFDGDDVTPIFTAGGDRWLFSNFQTDAGGLEMGATSDWMWLNVIIDGTFYSIESPDDPVGSMTVHGNEYHDPAFATEVAMASLDGIVSNLNNTVGNLSITVSGHTGSIANLQGNITILQGDVLALQSTVSGHTVDIANLQGNLSVVQGDISALQGAVSSLQSIVAGHASDIANLQGNVTALQSTVSSLQTTVNTHTSQINSLNSTLLNHVNNTTDVHGIVSPLVVGHKLSPRCKVYRGTSAQSIVSQTWTKIQFNTEAYDTYNEFDSATNYRFTATVAGTYLVMGGTQINVGESDSSVDSALRKNGSEVGMWEEYTSLADAGIMSYVYLVTLAVNDYIEGWCAQNNPAPSDAKDLIVSTSRNYMEIFLLSAS